MNKHAALPEIRQRLDEAITYGSREQAFEIAAEGLKAAEAAGLKGEIEYFKGQFELLNENYATAIDHFKAAIKNNPLDGGSYNDLALCLAEAGLIDEALSCFDKGISVESDYATIHHNKGWLLNNIGRHKEAIDCFNKALGLEPERAVTYDNLADAQYNLGDYAQSIASYRKVLGLLKDGCCEEIKKEIEEKISEIDIKMQEKENGLKDD